LSDRERTAALEHAIRWLSAERRERPDAKPGVLAEEAARRFDLSPRDADFLLDFARGAKAADPA
jgi:hypothetical protein